MSRLIVPFRLFDDKSRKVRFTSFAIELGIEPSNWLQQILRNSSCVRFVSEDGILPLKLLYESNKKPSCDRFPSDLGIDPEKLQPTRPKTCKDFKLPIDSGNSPEKDVRSTFKSSRGLLQLDFGN